MTLLCSSALAISTPDSPIEQLQLAAGRWLDERRGTDEWRRIFHKTLGMINLREFPTSQVAALMSESSLGRLSPGYANLQHRVHEAMVQYRVKDAIIHQFDPRPHQFQDAIHTTTQDRPGRLAIWLVRRGRSLLPWHGVGCLDSRGLAEVVHATDICDGNYYPEFIPGEKTPFVYRKAKSFNPWKLASLQETLKISLKVSPCKSCETSPVRPEMH